MYKVTVRVPNVEEVRKNDMDVHLECGWCHEQFVVGVKRTFAFCSHCNERYEMMVLESKDGETHVDFVVV